MRIDDRARCRIDAAPEAEGLIEHQHWCGRTAPSQRYALRRHAPLRHSSASRHTSPRTADSTHSRRLPKMTRRPRLFGAYQAHFAEFVITAPGRPVRIGVM